MPSLYSSWNECNVTQEEAEQAKKLYILYCSRESIKPEINESENISQFESNPELLGHVIYHAQECMGMNSLIDEN